MKLGVFSLSLAVKDIAKSKEFYGKLGFEVIGGNEEENWLILKNDKAIIGLFQGMFDHNTLTFNPGWDKNGDEIEDYTDIRDLQKSLKESDMVFHHEADEDSEGPASFVLVDPDGNPVLVDQHR